MADDQGKMTRKDVAKLGVSLAVLGMMMQPGSAKAGNSTNTASHTNTIAPNAANPNCVTHTNVTTEVSIHSNHSDGGWMC